MKNQAYINSQILKWARTSAKITQEKAAKKINVSIERIDEWESGVSFPTIRQAKILSSYYKRPFAILFLPEVPKDFQPLKDFRSKSSKEISTSTLFIIREIQEKQSWLSEIKKENKESKNTNVGKFTYKDDPKLVAQDILNTLKINPEQYELKNPIMEWVQKSEFNGIFISKTSFLNSRQTLDSTEFQGFAIADSYAPFIFINSSDWNTSQLFTLVHELAHIWIAETGISNQTEFNDYTIKANDPIEAFCNKVSANALMPESYLKTISIDSFQTPEVIFKYSKRLGVSSFAFIIRAYSLKIINKSTYENLKKESQKSFEAYLEKEKIKKENSKGVPNYYLLQLNRNSKSFTQNVLDAYHGGHIAPNLASTLLNTKIDKFNKLEEQIYR